MDPKEIVALQIDGTREKYHPDCFPREWAEQEYLGVEILEVSRDNTQDGEEWVCFECFEAII